MHVPLLDLRAQYESIREEIAVAVQAVFDSQQFILGPVVRECEERLAAYCGSAEGVGVSSGTDALLMALMAEGIGAGDEVITPDYSFFATAGSVVRAGAVPVFVDIDPSTFNMDPDRLREAITERTRAVIPVHLYGQMAEMDPILEVAERYDLVVIEDAAQAIGAEYHGRRAGSLGHYGCFSFFPSKNLGAAGDAGLVTTREPERAERLRILRNHGAQPKYHHRVVGGNFRLDAVQAAVIGVKLRHLDTWTLQRQENAGRYREMFARAGLSGNGRVQLPAEASGRRHIYNQFVIRVMERNALRDHLERAGIGTEVYYPIPFHRQGCFAGLVERDARFPMSDAAAQESLALPIYPELTADHQQEVVGAIARFFHGR